MPPKEDPLKEKIGILLSVIALAASIVGPLSAWGATQARLAEVEKKADKQSDNNSLTVRHEALIPTLQQDVRDIKVAQATMAQKIDKQYDTINQDIKELIRLAKA